MTTTTDTRKNAVGHDTSNMLTNDDVQLGMEEKGALARRRGSGTVESKGRGAGTN